MNKKRPFSLGLSHGIPICLGYLSVSFAFGVFAAGSGLGVLQTLLVSMTNVTSAGQLSAVPILMGGGSLIELAFTQLVINLRYSLMSVSLSQKFDGTVRLRDRFLIAFINTDEVFAVASSQEGRVGRRYMFGLILLPYLGWSLGTLAGALAGNIFPPMVTNALGVAIYGMFVAICLPEAKKDQMTALCMAFAVALSCLFRFAPVLDRTPSGFTVIICAVTAAALFAALDCRRARKEKGGDGQ